MKEAENYLWGAASTRKNPQPSKVDIHIEITDSGQQVQPFAKDNNIPIYAAFPLRPERGAKAEAVLVGVKFALRITFPDDTEIKRDVESALWAWETFGGIGARTRRGFGALRLVGINGNSIGLLEPDDIKAKICERSKTYVEKGEFPKNVPHLLQDLRMVVKDFNGDPTQTWVRLVNHLRDFRQWRNPGKNPPYPGRSLWPEPDAIRKLTGDRAPDHADPISNVEKFPRAAFGLPIEFRFKDENIGDPCVSRLQGASNDYSRFASPLILRPIACQGGKAVGLALVLEGTSVEHIPGGLQLKDNRNNYLVEAAVTKREAQKIVPLNGTQDVLQAFLNFVARR